MRHCDTKQPTAPWSSVPSRTLFMISRTPRTELASASRDFMSSIDCCKKIEAKYKIYHAWMSLALNIWTALTSTELASFSTMMGRQLLRSATNRAHVCSNSSLVTMRASAPTVLLTGSCIEFMSGFTCKSISCLLFMTCDNIQCGCNRNSDGLIVDLNGNRKRRRIKITIRLTNQKVEDILNQGL